jgi:capsular polysaccharide transport system permease protein
MGSGLGMLFCALAPSMPSLRNLTNPFLVRPLFFTSGLFFTAEMLPKGLRDVLLYNPVLHVIEYLRSSFFVEFDSANCDLGYAGTWALGLFAIGFATMQSKRDQLLLP